MHELKFLCFKGRRVGVFISRWDEEARNGSIINGYNGCAFNIPDSRNGFHEIAFVKEGLFGYPLNIVPSSPVTYIPTVIISR